MGTSRYSKEFKAEAVRLFSAGNKSVAQLAKELGVGSHNFPSFGAQLHGLFTPCVRFAVQVTHTPRNTRFRLVANPLPEGTFTQGVSL